MGDRKCLPKIDGQNEDSEWWGSMRFSDSGQTRGGVRPSLRDGACGMGNSLELSEPQKRQVRGSMCGAKHEGANQRLNTSGSTVACAEGLWFLICGWHGTWNSFGIMSPLQCPLTYRYPWEGKTSCGEHYLDHEHLHSIGFHQKEGFWKENNSGSEGKRLNKMRKRW